ncbi:hypothetical protein GCM10010289_00130 [Streptomyces violascens]|uniref:Uncharacterized protein n=1 Tax=Streptomyces violascens TaxID=67381 RepID=A0ABQ3QRX8_9ACTN|nr:hypothetical protein GCM10010289_00130 [Streptomyces violascens]GHI40029.1 hypothetical protein Sviol_44370 [Streptomyces violascens]
MLLGELPPGIPEACRAALPDLLRNGFLAGLSGDQFRLDPQVRHLSGLLPKTRLTSAVAQGFEFDADAWEQWKNAATPALRRHVESVEYCALSELPVERAAEAFMSPCGAAFFSKAAKNAYGRWKDANPDRGPQAAEFTVTFRAAHGHGPSFKQLSDGLGWHHSYQLRGFVVHRLLSNGWLTRTGPVPWTLRPGPTAQQQGITLPRARGSATVTAFRQALTAGRACRRRRGRRCSRTSEPPGSLRPTGWPAGGRPREIAGRSTVFSRYGVPVASPGRPSAGRVDFLGGRGAAGGTPSRRSPARVA